MQICKYFQYAVYVIAGQDPSAAVWELGHLIWKESREASPGQGVEGWWSWWKNELVSFTFASLFLNGPFFATVVFLLSTLLGSRLLLLAPWDCPHQVTGVGPLVAKAGIVLRPCSIENDSGVHFLGYLNHRPKQKTMESFFFSLSKLLFFSLLSPSGSRPSTPKSDSELVSKSTDRSALKSNLEMLWLWGELPQAAKVSLSLLFCPPLKIST